MIIVESIQGRGKRKPARINIRTGNAIISISNKEALQLAVDLAFLVDGHIMNGMESDGKTFRFNTKSLFHSLYAKRVYG